MQNYIPSQHLTNNGKSNKLFIPLNQESYCDSHQQPNSFSFNTPELSEKKLELLKRLLLLQQKKNVSEIGDPTFLLDENFELSPSNYHKLLEYTKHTAEKLNTLMTQSSQLFSSYLNGFQAPVPTEPMDETLNYMQSPSMDSNSTRDSDQYSDINISIPSENVTPKNSLRVKDTPPKISRAWDSEKDKLLIKLVCKYNKDWKKVHEGLSNVYQTKFAIDFLRERYRQLYYSNQKLNKYTQKSNQMEEEPTSYAEDINKVSYQVMKKVPNGFKNKQRVEATRKNLLDNMLGETDNSEQNYHAKNTQETESLQLFYTKDHHMESKTVDVNWISFDFETEFGQQEQLFERVTSSCLF
jgi:hypothetical protein